MQHQFVLTPEQYKSQLTVVLSEVLTHSASLKDANSQLTKLISMSIASFDFADVIERALRTWLDAHCQRLTSHYQGDTEEKITLVELDTSLKDIPAWLKSALRKTRTNEDKAKTAIASFIEEYDFTLLVNSFSQMSASLFDNGLTTIAEQLLSDLSLVKYTTRDIYKVTNRHVVFDLSIAIDSYSFSNSYSYNTREKLARIKSNIMLAEKQCGNLGLGRFFNELFDTMNEGLVSSGTTIGNKGVVEARIFNGHIRLSLTHDVFSGLMSFLIVHKKEKTDIHLPPSSDKKEAA